MDVVMDYMTSGQSLESFIKPAAASRNSFADMFSYEQFLLLFVVAT